MELDYKVFLYLAVILLSTKFLGILFRRIGMPQVVGALVAGILIGPAVLGIVPAKDPVITFLAEIGVVMLMFSAGLETNMTEIRKNGVASVLITVLGVIVPFVGGFLVAWGFEGFGAITDENLVRLLFFGVLLTATSVGITVEVLKELGKLKGKVGTSIMSAAVLDDIIGIIVLTIVIGMKDPSQSIGKLSVSILIFFAIAIVAGIALHYLFKAMERRFPVTRRLPILGLAVCFLFAWVAEEFGIADITGAFVAGMMFSNMSQTHYVERKIDINSYMIFSPVFFASIGIGMDFSGFTMKIFWFSVVLVIVALITKVIGCGIGAKICGFTTGESLKVGYGMMARGEVGIIVAQKGVYGGIIGAQYMPAAILLVIISSLVTPICMKMSYNKDKKAKLVDLSDGDEPPTLEEGAMQGKVNNGTDLSTIERPIDMSGKAFEEAVKMSLGSDSDNDKNK